MKPQASTPTVAAMLPAVTWSYVIDAGRVQGQGEVSATDAFEALAMTLTLASDHLSEDTFSGALGVRAEELRYALNPDSSATEHVLNVPHGTLTLKKQISSEWERLNLMAGHLRQEYRIKQNVDYSFTYKYGQLHVLCQEVYADAIREACAKYSFQVTSLQTYS